MPAPVPVSPSKALRQSVLSFKPRTSSSLAEPIVLTDSDDDNPVSKQQTMQQDHHRAPNGVHAHGSRITPSAEDRDEIDFTTPPLAAASTRQRFPDDDDDDDDLSDPPPLGLSSPKQVKKLTKKRPSIAGNHTASGGPSKKMKSDGKKGKLGFPKADSSDQKQVKKLAAWGQGPLCHHHRSACQTEMIRCTMIRSNGQRCALKYCDRALKMYYDANVADILSSSKKDPNLKANEHDEGEAADYFFKCPRCKDQCQCSLCRRKGGLAPLGGFKNRKGSVEVHSQEEASTSRIVASPSASTSKPASKSKTVDKKAGTKEKKNVGKTKTAAVKASNSGRTASSGNSKKTVLKAKATEADTTIGSDSKVIRQTSLSRPLKAPVPVPAPELQVIQTALKRENIEARIWVYETLVRFDFIKVPKAILSQLDKFEQWTHRQLQMLLERIIIAVAGMNSIHSNNPQPKAKAAPVVRAYREHGNDLSRGEAWQAARALCASVQVHIPTLPHVERSFEDEAANVTQDRDDTPADLEPTLLGSRLTRTRRAAEVKALERVKLQSLAEFESMEGSSSEDEEDDDSNQYNSQAVDSEGEGWDEEDEEDAAPTQGARRPGGQNGRVASTEGSRRSGRQRQAPTSFLAETAAAASSARKSSRQVVAASSASATSSASDRDTATPAPEANGDDVRAAPPAEPIPVPDMEEKIAILCGLLEAVMQTPEVAAELKMAAVRLPLIDKARQEELKEHEKEWEEMKKEIWTSAPSMSQADIFNKWKIQKEKKEKNFKLRILETKLNAYKETEANKLRGGPLGVDADGRVYWQLTEFNENMPANTMGRWAWCVLIYGEPMTKHAPPPESMPANIPNISPLKVDRASKEPNEVAPEDSKIERFAANDGDTSMVILDLPTTPVKRPAQDGAVPTDAESSSSSLSSPSPVPDDGKVFMGTNYPASIAAVISFIKYRCAQLDYEESKAQREQELRAHLDKIDQPSNGSPSSPRKSSDSSTPIGRKAKRQLKEAQEARKARIDELCAKLELCRTYYMWHAGEVEAGDAADSLL